MLCINSKNPKELGFFRLHLYERCQIDFFKYEIISEVFWNKLIDPDSGFNMQFK